MADDILKEAQDAFRECQERDRDNHLSFEKDMRFARLEEQWPELNEDGTTSLNGFSDEARLTINKLAPIIRQVVNDARQNKPAITVRPQDNDADPETAEIMTGLIRNIESTSDADIAYDTAVDHAVSGGFGYFRVNLEYACDDNWDQDIVIQRVPNPLAVYGDPYSTAADSSDWNVAFVTDQMGKDAFRREYPGATETDWDGADFPGDWREGDRITVAEYWTRSKVTKKLIRLLNPMTGEVMGVLEDDIAAKGEELYAQGFTEQAQTREVMSYDVKQHILTALEELDSTEWAGKYIPIIPVYGDEVVLKNKRYFRSLISSAIDAQRMYNYWASKTTQVVALAPRSPFIAPKGAFDSDPNWDKVNDESIPYLEYDGQVAPARQPFTGVPVGMMQEMMNAAEHIKAVTGIYDASLGARSNETSGVAIRNRQMEGDTSTFHFIDNLSRAIRHGGRVMLDLIPKVYDSERVVRVLGQDNKAKSVPLKQPVPVPGPDGQPQMQEDPATGQMVPITRIYDLTLGKYDLAVEVGPSYTSRREETRAELVEVIRAVPDAAPVLGPMYLRSSDWPGADEAADKLEAMNNPQQGLPPEIEQQMQQGMQMIQQLQGENAELKAGRNEKMAELQLKSRAADQKDRELEIKAFEAETQRIQAQKPEFVPARLAG